MSYIVWLLLTCPYSTDKGWDGQIVILGLGVAFLVAVIFKEAYTSTVFKFYSPRRWFWFIVYIPVFFYYCIKANLDVLYRVVHPEMPIKPGIVKIKTNLRSPSALTALANSITLTPGTMSVDITEDGYLYIHWIYVRSTETEAATRIIAQRFETFIRRIFE
jgi:multicomponent Na+:H+ antiporter subunit E